jgi:hypothetical protein
LPLPLGIAHRSIGPHRSQRRVGHIGTPHACPGGTQIFTSNPTRAWLGTNAYSYWLGGPGSIGYTATSTVTTSWTYNVNLTVTANAVVASVATQLGLSVSAGTSVSSAWAYNITVPAGVTARARVYKHAYRVNVKEEILNASCTVTTLVGYAWFPDSSNGTSEYCITRDSYPGNNILGSACAAH